MKVQVQRQRAVILIITLIMLAVVTLMAITFLAVSRRERTTVTVSQDQMVAQQMANAALQRAQSEEVARVLSQHTASAIEMLVSTNFNNPIIPYPASSAGTAAYLHYLANLQLDPRPPVYIQTNANPVAPLDFRYYLDLNRNGLFDPNGWFSVPGDAGLSNYYVGDPEWIGVLQNPDAPYSGTNQFVGRYAFLVQPAGKSLDWNYIGNETAASSLNGTGYMRNEGVGSWELNLAAFLYDLNTNYWPGVPYSLDTGLPNSSPSESLAMAAGFLNYRYAGSLANLAPATSWFGPQSSWLVNDRLDWYSDGPLLIGWSRPPVSNDNPNRPWPGSDNPRKLFQLDELFSTNAAFAPWLNHLRIINQQPDVYDRYTFYRMLSQIGTATVPANQGRMDLNYNNVTQAATNLVAWTPTEFFYNAASRILAAYEQPYGNSTNYVIGDTVVPPSFSLTNIEVYPVNEYTATVHRLLQVALNLYDATTTRFANLPTVMQPRFTVDGNTVYISSFVQVTNAAPLFTSQFMKSTPSAAGPLLQPYDLTVPADRQALRSKTNALVYDVPLIIGAKKGFPNFNEFAMQNFAEVTRKAELLKRSPFDARPYETNLLYLFTISNRFGIELWNSYTNPFTGPLRIQGAGDFQVTLTNAEPNGLPLRITSVPYQFNFMSNTWAGRRFSIPVARSVTVASNEIYTPVPRPLLVPGNTITGYTPNLGFYLPQVDMVVSNHFWCAMVDERTSPPQLVDYVAFGRMAANVNVMNALSGPASLPSTSVSAAEPPNVWLTNRIGGSLNLSTPMEGVMNQIEISLGNEPVSLQQWRSYSQASIAGQDKAKSIDRFRVFCGLQPITYTSQRDIATLRAQLRGKYAMQAPFSPSRKVYENLSWQANDPLVHYLMSDLLDPTIRPNDPNRTNAVQFVVPPNRSITNWNIGQINGRYRPWGGNPQQSTDPIARDARFKDPMIRQSDDWDFPTNRFPNVGWIGRVHRGTPWQTIYLKSGVAPTNTWFQWAGSYGTNPTNDWRLVDLFTTAPNDNAASGLVSVNQTNLAAWAAVLSGVPVLSNTTPATVTSGQVGWKQMVIEPDMPGEPQLREIVAGINRTRDAQANLVPGGQGEPYFSDLGSILATPQLTMASPFINTNNLVNDQILERIPQQVLSLLRPDDPQFVVYAFGQTLKPAPNSLYLGAGQYNRLCTNYEVRAECVTRTVVRLEGPQNAPRAVVESYNELTPQ